jgi:hypothetical protein
MFARIIQTVKNLIKSKKLFGSFLLPLKQEKLMSKPLFQPIIGRIQDLLSLIDNQNLAKIVGSSLFFVCARDYYESTD